MCPVSEHDNSSFFSAGNFITNEPTSVFQTSCLFNCWLKRNRTKCVLYMCISFAGWNFPIRTPLQELAGDGILKQTETPWPIGSLPCTCTLLQARRYIVCQYYSSAVSVASYLIMNHFLPSLHLVLMIQSVLGKTNIILWRDLYKYVSAWSNTRTYVLVSSKAQLC